MSFVGTQMTMVALPVQVYQLTGSAFAVGLLGAVELLPVLTLGLLGGAGWAYALAERATIAPPG